MTSVISFYMQQKGFVYCIIYRDVSRNGGKKLVICPNCGAEIEKDSTRCPYCGYINIEGAEKKHLADIKKIKDKIAKKKEEPDKALAKGFFRGIGVIIITVSILVLLAVAFFVQLRRGLSDAPKEFLSPSEQAEASAYKEIVGEQLEQAYEQKDIERMAQIFDKAYSEDRVNIWGIPHYETARASSYYIKIKKIEADLDKGKIEKKEAEEITYYCFCLYYEAYGDDGAEIFDPIREDEIIPIITDRLGYTIEDMEKFRDKVMDPPYVDRIKVQRCTKKHYKNYK